MVIEDARIGEEMEQMYLDDLENATEIVLTEERRLAPASKPERRPGPYRLRERIGGGSSSRAAAGAIQIGRTVGAAITNRRPLGPAEARIMGVSGCCSWPRRPSRSCGRGSSPAAGRDRSLGGRLGFLSGLFICAAKAREKIGVPGAVVHPESKCVHIKYEKGR